MLHRDLRTLLTALFGAAVASTFSWHSIRIGLACSLHAADCPDAVIQLICRWASPDSLKVYRQMGIEKNNYWVGRAQSAVFDATRVNNLPALDSSDYLIEQSLAFGESSSDHGSSLPSGPATAPASVVAPTPTRSVLSYTVPGGNVQAHPSDSVGLVGLQVMVPSSFWQRRDVATHEPARIACTVAAECVREFRHTDGSRAHTYLLLWGSQYFPIKRDALVRVVLTSAQRAALDLA